VDRVVILRRQRNAASGFVCERRVTMNAAADFCRRILCRHDWVLIDQREGYLPPARSLIGSKIYPVFHAQTCQVYESRCRKCGKVKVQRGL
jgi:hypothetical protein